MKLAHLADLHVGYRAYDRQTKAGVNQREADVAESLRRAIDGVIAAQPDAVLLAGDVFHSVRPTNGAILRLFAELQRLRTGVPAADVLMIGGDHDTPRSSDASSILGLYRALGVLVVERDIEIVTLPSSGLMVTAVPKLRAAAFREWKGGGSDVLLLHGEARDVPGAQLDADFLAAGGWRYVALGHWHVCEQVAPRAWYAGSLDYTSTDPWSEVRKQAELGRPSKGWLLVELGGSHEPRVAFQTIEAPRRFLDLGPVDAEGLGATEINAALAAQADDIDGAVVRQIVLNLSRETARALDHAALRGYKARALNYHLDARRPEAQATTAEARAVRLKRLDEILDEFLGARELPPDVEREAFRRLGNEYFAAAATVADPYTAEKVPEVA